MKRLLRTILGAAPEHRARGKRTSGPPAEKSAKADSEFIAFAT
jgi:hypothetical protein